MLSKKIRKLLEEIESVEMSEDEILEETLHEGLIFSIKPEDGFKTFNI